MASDLHSFTKLVQDWVLATSNLNSTAEFLEGVSSSINVENGSKFIINKVSDDNVVINLLVDGSVVATSQLSLSKYAFGKDGADASQQSSFQEYLKDTFGGKIDSTGSMEPQGERAKDTRLRENLEASTDQGVAVAAPKVDTDLTDDRSRLDLDRENASGNFKPHNPNDPPGFEDEYQMLPHGNQNTSSGTGTNIGDRDLYPPGVGKHPFLKPHLDPLSEPSVTQGGGMHPTSSDPLFHPNPGQGGSLQRPPGARWDNPRFGSDDPEDIELLGQGLPGAGHFGSSGNSNPLNRRGGSGNGNPFGGSGNGGFGGGLGGSFGGSGF